MIKAVEIVWTFLPYNLAGLKHVMRVKGIETGPTRRPMPALPDGAAAEIERKLKSLELH
jgi:dihydrodipicolinate synthase/N-acetylneuraminate lyase